MNSVLDTRNGGQFTVHGSLFLNFVDYLLFKLILCVVIVEGMFSFEKLEIYQQAILLAEQLYKLTEQFPAPETHGLTSQLRRAVSSVALNIAEGSSRSKKDFSRFLDLSRGSCYECVAILAICRARTYLSAEEHIALYEKLNILCKRINKLKLTLREL